MVSLRGNLYLLKVLIGALGLILCSSLPVAAENKKIKICYDGWAPFYYLAAAGKSDGPVIRLLEEIAKEGGYEISFEALPFKRCLKKVNDGQIDILMLTGEQPERTIMGRVSLVSWQVGAIVHQDYPETKFNQLSDFIGKRVLLLQEYIYPEIIRETTSKWIVSRVGYFNVGQVGGIPAPFKVIENGQADILLEDKIYAEKMNRDHDLKLKVLEPEVVSQPNFLAYAQEREDLFEFFEQKLAVRAQDGRLDNLYRNILGKSWRELGNTVREEDNIF